MFTGLVEALGTVASMTVDGAGCQLTVALPRLEGSITIGESIAVNGACLTVVAHGRETCAFQVGPETLQRTNLGSLQVGDKVNLERSLRLGDRLGGHLVQGHVDGVGHVADRQKEGDWETVWFRCSHDLAAQMVSKGSVAVDGVSLTLVEVKPDAFSVALIPHTLAQTTLGFKGPGAAVNLETDMLAKYVWKCLQSMSQGLIPQAMPIIPSKQP
jgi:riboflavin synthase